MKIFLFFTFILTIQIGFTQSVEPFQIYNSKGRKVSTKKFFRSIEKSDIILFGEFHDNPIIHWLQLKTAQYLNVKRGVVIGAEMIESDQQEVINKYLAGEIDQKGLDSSVLLWTNYKTDYKPIVDFAKEEKISFYGTNVPRVHASFVYRHGLDELHASLDSEEKQFVAPLPIPYDENLPSYQAMLKMMGDHKPNPYFPMAQAIKDATMAYFILKYYDENKCFLHLNGAYHSNHYEGIYWYLKEYQFQGDITTISTVQQSNVKQFEDEYKGIADFIIVVDEEMTKTH